MIVAGIIAEYNPIHNGHIYHINKTKEKCNADIVIAIISGNFTQRGEAACLDKWTRAKMAIDEGVDLCLEMPVNFACNSAEQFAEGGIKILDSLGVVDYLSFGCESKKESYLIQIGELLANETDDFKVEIKKNLKLGNSFPKSRQIALSAIYSIDEKVLLEPNNILAIEYIKWIKKLNSKIKPLSIVREGTGHIESATKIRKMLFQRDFDELKNYLGEKSIDNIVKEKEHLLYSDNPILYSLIKYSIATKEKKDLEKTYAISEGIENKLLECVRKSDSLEELVENLKSKRYTYTRINRVLMQNLLGITKDSYTRAQNNMYTRVLAFNCKGREVLKYMKKHNSTTIPIYNNINRGMEKEYIETTASDIYNMLSGKNMYDFSDYVMKPYFKQI